MRLQIDTQNEGYLEVESGKNKTTKLEVNPSNFIEFYPLSLAYTYKYKKDTNELSLNRLQSSLPHYYNDLGYQKKVLETEYCKDLVVPDVWEDNLKVLSLAKEYDLPTPDEPYSLYTVRQGQHKLGLLYREVNKIIVDEYIKTLTPKELKVFLLKTKQIQLDKALRHTNQKTDNTYSQLGQLSVMLTLMKKISRK